MTFERFRFSRLDYCTTSWYLIMFLFSHNSCVAQSKFKFIYLFFFCVVSDVHVFYQVSCSFCLFKCRAMGHLTYVVVHLFTVC